MSVDRIICVCGPTATGKTRLGVALALEFGGEVVSADSMQIYRRMDVGTAKPEPGETMGVPHHMIDVAQPWEDYSAARYASEADAAIEGILARGGLPILVGGTGLYFDAVIRGLDFAPRQEDDGLRRELEAFALEKGRDALFERLRSCDPKAAERLHPNDVKRVIRAIEVYSQGMGAISEHDERSKKMPDKYKALMIGLDFYDREALYSRIDRRVDIMLRSGLEDEVRELLSSGVSEKNTSMQAIGYKEMTAFLRGEQSIDDAAENIKRATRRYAKRQLTWFRRYPDMHWIKQEEPPDFDEVRRISTKLVRDFCL